MSELGSRNPDQPLDYASLQRAAGVALNRVVGPSLQPGIHPESVVTGVIGLVKSEPENALVRALMNGLSAGGPLSAEQAKWFAMGMVAHSVASESYNQATL